jgi:hypothetical protein
LLVIYTPSYVYSARNPGLARRLAEGSAPKRETRVTEDVYYYFSKLVLLNSSCYYYII